MTDTEYYWLLCIGGLILGCVLITYDAPDSDIGKFMRKTFIDKTEVVPSKCIIERDGRGWFIMFPNGDTSWRPSEDSAKRACEEFSS